MSAPSRKWFADHTVKSLAHNPTASPSLHRTNLVTTPVAESMNRFNQASAAVWRMTLLALLLSFLSGIFGCGSGGYAGSGITSVSSSAVTLDAGQSFQDTASVSGNEPVYWSLSCPGSSCGTVANAIGGTMTYTAPSGITSQLLVTATASLPGTNSSQTVSITVNPDPAITGVLPAG